MGERKVNTGGLVGIVEGALILKRLEYMGEYMGENMGESMGENMGENMVSTWVRTW